jgi:hypothetical protein
MNSEKGTHSPGLTWRWPQHVRETDDLLLPLTAVSARQAMQTSRWMAAALLQPSTKIEAPGAASARAVEVGERATEVSMTADQFQAGVACCDLLTLVYSS